VDPESKKLLEATFQLAQENNHMLHKVRSVQKWATFWRTLKILVVIGIALGSFYFLEPYLNKIANLYNSISGMEQKLNGGSSSFQDLLKKFQN
jgi:uncharacterized protein involved in cysteine biosynthesis